MNTDALTNALTNVFNWIVLTLGVDMSESEMLVEYSPTPPIVTFPANSKAYVDVTFTIKDRSTVLAEVDFRLVHALVIAFKPAGNVTIGGVDGSSASLSIGLGGIFLSSMPSKPGRLSDFQVLAIKRLGGYRPYENS